MKLTTATLKRLVLIEQKKFGAESRLRRQIREHVSRLLEGAGAAAPGMSEEDVKKLNDLQKESPKDVDGFSKSLSKISEILGGLSTKPVVAADKISSAYADILESISEIMSPAPAGAKPAGGTQQAAKGAAAPAGAKPAGGTQ